MSWGEVLIPEAVARETRIVPPGTSVVSPSSQDLLRVLCLQLDEGEAAAVSVAVERQAGLVVDERRARRVAARFGVPLMGTLGVLLLAGRRGLIADPWETALHLRAKAFFLSDEVLASFRQRSRGNETSTWPGPGTALVETRRHRCRPGAGGSGQEPCEPGRARRAQPFRISLSAAVRAVHRDAMADYRPSIADQ